MLLILYFLILILNLIYIIIEKRNKLVEISSFTLFFFILLGNNKIPDYNIYYENFIGNQGRNYIINEIGYNFLVKIGNNLSLTYFSFRASLIFITLLLIYVYLLKLNANIHIYSFFYMLSNIFLDSVQIRVYIGLTFIFISIYYLSLNKNKKSIFLVLFATMIHYMYLYFLGFLLLFLVSKKKDRIFKFIVILLFFFNLFLVFFLDKLSFINIISEGLYRKILIYSREKTRFSIVIVFIFYIMTFYIHKKYLKYSIRRTKHEFIIKRMIEFSFLVIPIFLINMNIYRILKVILYFLIIFFSINYKKIRKKYSFLIFFLFYSMYWVFFDIYSSKIIERVFKPLFF